MTLPARTTTIPAFIGPVEPPALHVMTFNVRRRMPAVGPRSADRWALRAPAVAAMLDEERPHLLGTQEVLPSQNRLIAEALGDGYTRVGHGRNSNGQGEGCPLYFDNTRLDLVQWHQAALSDTPEVAGSRSWGNRTPRTFVRAELRDRATGIHLLAINTHFDNVSRRSRVQSARLIRVLVEHQPLPAIVTGDFNSGEGTAPLTELFSDGELSDAWAAAAKRLSAEWGTFPNYHEPRHNRKRIDWIAVSRGIQVDLVGINTRQPGGVWPSDHLPVQAIVRLPSAT